MEKAIGTIHGMATLLIFGGALLADGLAEIPHGFLILFGIILAGGALVAVGNWLEDAMYARAAAEPQKGKCRERWR